MALPSLYTFIDEGGDLNFSSTGTRYFTLTAVTLARPFPLDGALAELRFDLLEKGTELDYFHASEDLQSTRDAVFALIQRSLDRFRVDSVVVEKRKAAPVVQELHRFYPEMLGYLLRYLVDGNRLAQLVRANSDHRPDTAHQETSRYRTGHQGSLG